ncbi:MAG: DUF47 domain-containing protein [Clostridiaceae bacterium]
MFFKKLKDYDYISEFEKLSRYSVMAAEFLDAVLRNYDLSLIPEKTRMMHEIEHEADVEKDEMYEALINEFLPPIEKDDIIRLSHEIDTVTDSIEDVLICIDIFALEKIHPEINLFTELIVDCCGHMNKALAELNNYKNSTILFEQINEVNLHKSKGKALYVNSLRNLWKITEDPVLTLTYTEIYKNLEECCEKCKMVTNTLERIVIKNL